MTMKERVLRVVNSVALNIITYENIFIITVGSTEPGSVLIDAAIVSNIKMINSLLFPNRGACAGVK